MGDKGGSSLYDAGKCTSQSSPRGASKVTWPRGPWKWRAVESKENQQQVSPSSHRPWKSPKGPISRFPPPRRRCFRLPVPTQTRAPHNPRSPTHSRLHPAQHLQSSNAVASHFAALPTTNSEEASISRVTGPWFRSETDIDAWNTPACK